MQENTYTQKKNRIAGGIAETVDNLAGPMRTWEMLDIPSRLPISLLRSGLEES